MKKGVSPFVSTTVVILFGIIMIAVVFSSLNVVERQGVDKTVQDQLTFTQRELATEVLGVYDSVKEFEQYPAQGDAVLVKDVDISLPQTIGGREYRIDTEEPQDILLSIVEFKIDGETVSSESKRPTARLVGSSGNVEVEHKIFNIDVGLQGLTKGSDTDIRGYVYNNNGEMREKVVLGGDDILIGLTKLDSQEDSDCGNDRNVTMEGFVDYFDNDKSVSDIDLRFTVLETEDKHSLDNANGDFSTSFCADVDEFEEYVITTEASDSDSNRGFIRKRFIG